MLITAAQTFCNIVIFKAFLLFAIQNFDIVINPDQQVNYQFPQIRGETYALWSNFVTYGFSESLPLYMDELCDLYFTLPCTENYQSALPFEKHCNPTKLYCCNTDVPPDIKIMCPTCKVGYHFPGSIPESLVKDPVNNRHCNHRVSRDDKESFQKFNLQDYAMLARQSKKSKRPQSNNFKKPNR